LFFSDEKAKNSTLKICGCVGGNMISENTKQTLSFFGLSLDIINLSSSSMIIVGVKKDSSGDRFVGRVSRHSDADNFELLNEALENALHNFDPKWKEKIEKVEAVLA
jgi:hypothetical protein